MKTSLLFLLFTVASLGAISADTTTTPAPTTGASAPSDDQQARMEKFKAALDKLDLTDAQKEKIKNIRATVTDHKERRHQVMAVLTPAQKEKLKQMIHEHRNETQGGGTTTGKP